MCLELGLRSSHSSPSVTGRGACARRDDSRGSTGSSFTSRGWSKGSDVSKRITGLSVLSSIYNNSILYDICQIIALLRLTRDDEDPDPVCLIINLQTERSLFDFAQSHAAKAAHDQVFTQFGNVLFEVFANSLVRVLDERLVQKTTLGKVFF